MVRFRAAAAAFRVNDSRGGNRGKRLRQDDAAILSGLSTRRYAALERGAVENPSLDLIENVASGLRMTPAERSALHVLSRGQDPPMPPAAPWPKSIWVRGSGPASGFRHLSISTNAWKSPGRLLTDGPGGFLRGAPLGCESVGS